MDLNSWIDSDLQSCLAGAAENKISVEVIGNKAAIAKLFRKGCKARKYIAWANKEKSGTRLLK